MRPHLESLRRLALPVLAVALLCPVALSAAVDPESASPTVIAALKDSASLSELEKNLAALKEQGASAQQLVEVKLIYILLRSEDAADYAAIVGEVQKLKPAWNTAESFQMFPNARSLDAFDAFMQARQALDRGDAAAFETQAKNALFLAAGTELSQKCNELVAEFLQTQTPVALNLAVLTEDGGRKTLGELAAGQKAVYMQVWATWCGPCIATFPALKSRADKLPPQGVAVVALNNELGRGENSAKAAALRRQHQMDGVTWYHESADSPFVQSMSVDSVPRAIVFNPQGKVLFNGHPLDPKLARVLASLDVTFDVMAGLEDPAAAAGSVSP